MAIYAFTSRKVVYYMLTRVALGAFSVPIYMHAVFGIRDCGDGFFVDNLPRAEREGQRKQANRR